MKLNFTFKKWHSLILLLFILGFSNQASALTFWVKGGLTGSAGTPLVWTTATNWTTTADGSTIAAGRIPTTGDTVNILVGKYVSIPLGSTGVCDILNIIGTTANFYIQGSSTLTCNTININTGGNLTMVTLASNVCRINCDGIINVGIGGNTTATGKGTLTVVATSELSMSKLVIGTGTSPNASTIVGRTGTAIFKFTGSGSDVIPFIAAPTSNISTTPIFGNVKFNSSGTITIPSGFSAKVMSIDSGTVDFGANYSQVYTAIPNTSLTMLGSTNLIIGGNNQFPSNSSLIFDPSSTIIYNGNDQTIRALNSTYKNLTLSGGSLGTVATKTLESGITVDNTLKVDDYTIFDLNDQSLTIWGNYINGSYTGTFPNVVYTKGSGSIRSSGISDIWYRGNTSSYMQFDQTNPGTTNVVKNIKLGETLGVDSALAASDENPLNLTIENNLNIIGTVDFITGHLVSNGNVTFKSNAATTAFVGRITDLTYCGIVGDVTVERFIPAGSNFSGGTNLGRGFRALSSSVTGGTVFSNWQENGSTTSVEGSIAAGILTTPTPNTLNPLAVGMHISGTGIPPNTTITGDNGDNTYTLLTTLNDPISRPCRAFADINSTTVIATFRSTIANNIMTVTAPITGTLAVGQKITGMYPAISNIVITALGSGTGGAGTYTIGVSDGSLNVSSTEIYYNGANAGFGTHITGKVGTADKLGQVDATTGFDLTVSGNPSLFTFNQTTQGWDAITSTKDSNLEAGTPYLLTIRGDRTIDLALNSATPTDTTLRSTGTIVAGDVGPHTLSTTTADLNYIGNPYQAPVNLMDMQAIGLIVGLEHFYTVFDSTLNTRGGYVTVDLTDGSNTVLGSVVNGTLQPNQAFFIRTADNTVSGDIPSLTFQEAYKVSDVNAYVPVYRKAKSTTSKINGAIYNTTDSTKALDGFSLSFSDNYSNTIAAEDAIKLTGNQDEIFASVNGAKIMAIDKRNFPAENDVIALNLTQERLSDYILKFNVSNFDAKDAYLVDAYTKKETALKNNQINSYAFSVDATPASAAADRFSIVFKTATALSVISNSIEELAVYPNPVVDNKFTIRANQDFGGKKATLSIVNTLGQKVYSTNGTFSTDGSIAVKPTNALNKGVYFLKVAVDGKEETKKLIIK